MKEGPSQPKRSNDDATFDEDGRERACRTVLDRTAYNICDFRRFERIVGLARNPFVISDTVDRPDRTLRVTGVSPLERRFRIIWCAVAATVGTAGCVHNPPNVGGAPVAPSSSNQYWSPPPAAVIPDSIPKVEIPPDLAQRAQNLTLPDLVDIALLNNPQTRESYANARAAGAGVGVAMGKYLPQVSLNVPLSVQRTTSSNGAVGGSGTVVRQPGTYAFISPSLSVSWLLFDFGERSAIDVARQNSFAESYLHNATVQEVILVVEQAYFNYNAAKAVRDAQRVTLQEDSANLAAAKARHSAGVATISDVLQAQTVLSQAEVDFETDEGAVQTTRGSLAIAIGVPATVPYDIRPEPPQIPVQQVAASVDSLVNEAVRSRPDLAAYRAQARAAAANVGVVRGQGLPSLTLGGSTGRDYQLRPSNGSLGNTWTAQLGVSIPLFQGFQNAYGVLQARELAKASAANAEYQRDQVVYQVFTSYYNLRTATAHVRSSNDLLASAQSSYNVAHGKYEQGVGSILDLLTAEAALASARSQQIQSHWDWYSNLAQLSHDVGVIGLHGEPQLPLPRTPRDSIVVPDTVVVPPVPPAPAVPPSSPSSSPSSTPSSPR